MATKIQDPIHGYIALDDVEEAVVDTPPVQRLRRVRQLGFAHLVYPSATHSRFEHSLGAMHLAGQFADALDLPDARRQELRLAALLHDVGHGPFSHVSDRIFHDRGTRHEEFSRGHVRASPIADVLTDAGVDPGRVCALIGGEGELGAIIAGHIDVDRMDYLMRDAHYTGVAYGTIDAETIVRAARIHDGTLAYDAQYRTALESLLTARYLMMPTVYLHRTAKIAERMFMRAFEQLEAATSLTVERFATMDDPEILARMRSSSAAAEMIGRVEDRDLYKLAARRSDVEADALRERVQDATGLPRDAVLADRIEMPGGEVDVPLVRGGAHVPLDEDSALPSAIESELARGGEVRLYAPREHVDAVAEAAENV